MRRLLPRRLERVQLRAKLRQLGAKVADALKGFVALRRVEFLFCEGVVLVDGAGEGG